MNNPGKPDNIWELGDNSIEVPPGGELLSINRGSTYIRGEQYNVQDEDPNDMTLVPVTGSKTYKIENISAHEYVAIYVIGVLCPEQGGLPQQYKYVKSYNGSFNFVDDPNSAELKFDSLEACQGWISNHIDDTYTGLRFVAIQMSKPTDNKVLKVATSDYKLIEDISSYLANNNLTINRIGEGNDKCLFLTHSSASGLPNRYDVRSVDSMTISTNSIVNLEEYERSIRLDNSSDAIDFGSAKNLVYKATSPGFCEVFGPTGEKWLKRTGSGTSASPYDASLMAVKIRDYRGFEQLKIGTGLKDGG